MLKKGEITEELKRQVYNLEKYIEWLSDNYLALREYYFFDFENHYLQEIELSCDDDGFKKIINMNKIYVNKQKEFIRMLAKHIDDINENKISRQIEKLIIDCMSGMRQELTLELPNFNLIFDVINKVDFAVQYNSISILAKFGNVENNIILVGGNGSGKSSFANALKGNDTENICVIPAQKSLYFSINDTSMLSTRARDMQSVLLENNINKSKGIDDYSYLNFQNNQFTKLIIAMKEQYADYLMDCDESGKMPSEEATIYGQLKKVFEVILPDIKISFKSEDKEYMKCIRSGEKYHVNALSEGEKAIIYYAISVLMAKEDSFIVVDEPETYLNPSLTNLLWDYLVKTRSDCQFIFITHSVDFVLGRSEAKVAWIKSFHYPNKWEFEFLNDDFPLPKALMTEILGSKKPIAFCEGNDKASLDYTIYRALIGDTYTVIPVGGHINVIQNCETLNISDFSHTKNIGIIDGDNFSTEKISSLSAKGVKVLPFNEIEMLLLSDEVMEYTMRMIYPQDYKNRINEFKEEFYSLISANKGKIALRSTVEQVNEYIEKEKIQESKCLEDIQENLKKISEYNVNDIYNRKLCEIEEALKYNDYNQLLVLCNLKKQISKGLANTCLDNDYEIKAVQQVITNRELQELIRNKYLEDAKI